MPSLLYICSRAFSYLLGQLEHQMIPQNKLVVRFAGYHTLKETLPVLKYSTYSEFKKHFQENQIIEPSCEGEITYNRDPIYYGTAQILVQASLFVLDTLSAPNIRKKDKKISFGVSTVSVGLGLQFLRQLEKAGFIFRFKPKPESWPGWSS